MGYLSLLLISFVCLLAKGDEFNVTCPEKPVCILYIITLENYNHCGASLREIYIWRKKYSRDWSLCWCPTFINHRIMPETQQHI